MLDMRYSIIIPSFNHLNDCLKPCLESVIKFTNLEKTDGEVIVVLNGCTDDSITYVNSLISTNKRIRVLENTEAMGYTKAINWGIKEATGEYFILLNNDTQILWDDNWTERLLLPFRDKRVGVTGVSRIIDRASGHDFIIFFCAAIRADLVRWFGALDETYNPGGGEDIEYCIRMRKLGYCIRCVGDGRAIWEYVTDFPIYHAGEQTVHGLRNWGEIWSNNQLTLKERYREPLKYSIYIDHLGDYDEAILGDCINSIWSATSFSGINISSNMVEYVSKLEHHFDSVSVFNSENDWIEWVESQPGLVGIYLDSRIKIVGSENEWLRDIDRGVGNLYDYCIGQGWMIFVGNGEREWKYKTSYLV